MTQIMNYSTKCEGDMNVNIRLLVLELVGLFVVITLTLFLATGTFRWIAGWCFVILYFGFGLVFTIWLFRYDPSLLQERLTGLKKPNREAWDQVLMWLCSSYPLCG